MRPNSVCQWSLFFVCERHLADCPNAARLDVARLSPILAKPLGPRSATEIEGILQHHRLAQTGRTRFQPYPEVLPAERARQDVCAIFLPSSLSACKSLRSRILTEAFTSPPAFCATSPTFNRTLCPTHLRC